jgi:phosphoglycolate phosphatase
MIFFDLDGTLTDPAPGITSCMRHAADSLGVDVEEDLAQYIGPPLAESFRCILRSMDSELIEEAIRLYRERFGTIGLFENALYPGIPELLAHLSDAGHELRVVTSKPHIYAGRIIDHFELRAWLPKVYGSELDGTRADKGELIGYVLEKESIEGDRATMIGDRMHDIHGAKAHGLRTIGVLWGYGADGELKRAGADVIVAEVSEVRGCF